MPFSSNWMHLALTKRMLDSVNRVAPREHHILREAECEMYAYSSENAREECKMQTKYSWKVMSSG